MTYIEIDISRAGFVEAFGSNWGGDCTISLFIKALKNMQA